MDGAHYAAMLAYLDGVDRLELAIRHGRCNWMADLIYGERLDPAEQGWWAAWAFRSLERAGHYLTLSNAGRAPGFEARNEYDPRGMAEAIEVAKRQALSLIPHEHFHLCRWGAAQFMPVTWEVA